ncbi:hypothetical protein [Psychroserpens sp.]
MEKVVQIQERLLIDITALINKHNIGRSKGKLKLDVAVFYLSLFNSLISFNRDDDDKDIIRLDSQTLKKYNGRYKEYLNFFKTNNLIYLVLNYGADIKECNSYKLSEHYLNEKVICYSISDSVLLKKFDRQGIENFYNTKMEYCQNIRPHLVKCFDDNLEINTKRANTLIEPLLTENYNKYRNAKQLLLEFNYKEWRYSIKPESDNRLHSNLTRLNKVLRPTISYKGQRLGTVDIKSSQPYFFSVILKAILKKDINLLEQIGATKFLSTKNINGLFKLNIDREEIIKFVDNVINADLYDSFSSELSIQYDDEGRLFRKVSNFTKKNKRKYVDSPQRIEYYSSKRDLAKTVIMEIFYSSSKTTIPEAKVFRNVYPSVNSIMSFIKNECVEFHKLLTNIEAYCLLDYTAKHISKKFPETPLWSIHDCLVTTQNHVTKLKDKMEEFLYTITTLKPQTEIDLW